MICQTCEYDNPEGATECESCGKPHRSYHFLSYLWRTDPRITSGFADSVAWRFNPAHRQYTAV